MSIPPVHPSLSRRALAAGALASAGLWMASNGVHAQPARAWPQRSVTIHTPFAAGGTSHNLGSVVAAQMSIQLDLPVHIEEHGTSLADAARVVARARPDGHTALLVSNVFLGRSGTRDELGYDPLRDFRAVGLIGNTQVALVTRAGSGFASLAEMRRVAARRGAPVVAATFAEGSASHDAMVRLARLAGLPLSVRHYRGQGPAVAALLYGEVDISFINTPELRVLLAQKRVVPLASASAERLTMLPELLTLQEQGYRIVFSPWYGLVVPAATPDAVVSAFNTALNAAIGADFVHNFFAVTGVRSMADTPAAMTSMMLTEIAGMAHR